MPSLKHLVFIYMWRILIMYKPQNQQYFLLENMTNKELYWRLNDVINTKPERPLDKRSNDIRTVAERYVMPLKRQKAPWYGSGHPKVWMKTKPFRRCKRIKLSILFGLFRSPPMNQWNWWSKNRLNWTEKRQRGYVK